MKSFKLYLPVLILAATAFTSCKKNSSDTAATGIAFHLKATNTTTTLGRTMAVNTGALKVAGANVEWTSGTASANLLKFEAKQSGKEVEFKSSVQQSIDLFGANTSFGNLTIPAGTYDEIEFKAQLVPVGANAALELKGKLTSGAVVTNISFRADEAIEVKGEKHNVTITGGTVHDAITSMDLTKLMQTISAATLDNATRTNGEILITSTINSNLYNIILKNLRDLSDEEEWH